MQSDLWRNVLKRVVRLCLSIALLVIGFLSYAPDTIFQQSSSEVSFIEKKDVLQTVISTEENEEIEAKVPYYFFSSLFIAPYTMGAANENSSENSLLKYIAIHRASSYYHFFVPSSVISYGKNSEQKLLCQTSDSLLCRWQV